MKDYYRELLKYRNHECCLVYTSCRFKLFILFPIFYSLCHSCLLERVNDLSNFSNFLKEKKLIQLDKKEEDECCKKCILVERKKCERKKRKVNDMKMSKDIQNFEQVKRGKKVLNLKFGETLGEVKICHMSILL